MAKLWDSRYPLCLTPLTIVLRMNRKIAYSLGIDCHQAY